MEDREEEIRRMLQFPAGSLNPPDSEPRVYRMYRRYWGIEDPQTLQDYCTANMLQYELLDAAMGKFFKALKNQNLYDDAWIILIADHGEMNGVFGLIDKGTYLNPRVLRAPVFIKPPRSYNLPKKTVASPVSLLDIAPTIYEIAGLKTTERLDGYSLLRTAKGELRPEDKPILAEVWSHVVQNPCMWVVVPFGQDVWLYACNFSDDVDELYLIKDLDLPVNRFYDAAFESEKQTALELFHQTLVQDPRWAGYVTSFELKYPQFSTKDEDRQKFLK
jgi:arylsulfatase A-like enzyme